MTLSANATSTTFTNLLPATTVQFVTGAGTLAVTVSNVQLDPTSVFQALSGLEFTLSGGQTVGTLASSAGTERLVNSDGTFVTLQSVPTGWILGSTATGFNLNVLLDGGAGPAHTIIGGPGAGNIYHGNNSITGNGPHNPFLTGTVTFNLNIAGVTGASTVTGVIFQYGTALTPPATVPDGGATAMLLGLSITGLGWVRRKLA